MSTPMVAAMSSALLALVCAVIARPLLRWLPAPEEASDLRYAELISIRFDLVTAAVALVTAWVVLGLTPATLWPILLPLVAGGVLLGMIDVHTTFLPLRLHYLTFAATAVGVLVSAWWRDQWWSLVWAGLIAVAALACYGLIWWVSRGELGFGDVRLAALLGMALGAASPRLALWSFLLGSLVGAVWAIATSLRRQRGFAYGPSMLLGVPAAVIYTSIVG